MSGHIAIIGSGIAGVTFAEETRKLDRQARITLLTRETFGYYSRPLLSNGFSRDEIEARIVLKPFPALAQEDIAVESGVDVIRLDRSSKTLYCTKGGEERSLTYDKLILAAGSGALIPPHFRSGAGLFHALNSLDDLIALRRLREKIHRRAGRPRWAVIGGGLIGCEISADLAKAGDEVVLFHALPRLMERQLREEDSAALLTVLRDAIGVEVLLDQAVLGFEGEELNLQVKLAGGEQAGFHGLIVACGFQPRIELARSAGLETRRGIAVDEFMTTSDPDIHAIGDCAELPDGKLYAYVAPARNQGLWLAKYLAGQVQEPWRAPPFKPKAKVPGFEATHPYLF